MLFICTDCYNNQSGLVEVVALVQQLKMDFELLKSTCAAKSMAPPVDRCELMENTIGEMKERDKRASNIIVYNAPEPTGDQRANLTHDAELVQNSLDTFQTGEAVSIISTFRLGIPTPSKIRPLKVTLTSPTTVLKILAKQKQITLPNSMRIAPDRTPSQRDFLSRIRTELEERRATEPYLTIKYINGVPRIVKDTKNSNLPIAP